jgi:outer membrane protein insertion porin family
MYTSLGKIIHQFKHSVIIIQAFTFIFVLFLTLPVYGKNTYEINNIDFIFKETESIDKSELLDILQTSKKNIFMRSDLDQDMQRLRKYYFDNGFFDAVVDTAVQYDNEDKTVDINFIIIENQRYLINKISYQGLENLPDDIMKEIFNPDEMLLAGKPYIKTEVSIEIRRILDILQNGGYFRAQVDSAEGVVISKYLDKFKSHAGKVNVDISFIGTGRIYYFGNTRVLIKNNKYNIEDKYILRQIKYTYGEKYSQQTLVESERNIGKLAIIQTGRIQIDSINDQTGYINFVVNVNLNTKYTIAPNINAIDIDNLFFGGAGISYSDRYFIKGGTVFSLSLDGYFHSVDINKAELKSSLFQPFLFNNNISGSYNISLIYYNFDKSLQFTILRNLIRLNYYIAYYTFYNSVYSDLTFDLLRTRTKEEIKIDETNTLTETQVENDINSILGVTLVHDNTNSLFNPSSGFSHSITFENAGLLPRFIGIFRSNVYYSQYLKLYTPNRFFFDLSGDKASSIFACALKIGDLIEYGKGKNIQPVSRLYKFFSGGGSSLRGWGSRENGILEDKEDGGKFLMEGSLEYRWKLFASSSSFIKNFWTVYFLDFGNVWEKETKFNFKQIALAIGLGIRYDTFVGPLRIDIGFKLYDPLASDDIGKWLFDKPSNIFKKKKFAIHFGLGQAF